MTSRSWQDMTAGETGTLRRGRLRREAHRSVAKSVAAGIESYDRARHLPRLIPIEAGQLTDDGPDVQRGIVSRLARALRAERTRGRAGHWTYDLNRHIALRQAYAAERRRLDQADGRLKQIRRQDGGGSET